MLIEASQTPFLQVTSGVHKVLRYDSEPQWDHGEMIFHKR